MEPMVDRSNTGADSCDGGAMTAFWEAPEDSSPSVWLESCVIGARLELDFSLAIGRTAVNGAARLVFTELCREGELDVTLVFVLVVTGFESLGGGFAMGLVARIGWFWDFRRGAAGFGAGSFGTDLDTSTMSLSSLSRFHAKSMLSPNRGFPGFAVCEGGGGSSSEEMRSITRDFWLSTLGLLRAILLKSRAKATGSKCADDERK